MKHHGITLGDIAPAAANRPATALRDRIGRALRVLRTIIGAPDYDRYVAHMTTHHPGCELVTRDDFIKQRLESRYSRPGSRCC